MAQIKEAALNRLELLIGEKHSQLLAQKRVLVVGIGGVGSFAVEALARSGIGNLLLVDYDQVAISNLNRQIHAGLNTIGASKVLAMQARLAEIAPWCQVEAFQLKFDEDSDFLLDEIDFVIDAIDDIKAKVTLIKLALNKAVPIISCLGMANRLDSSLLEVTTLDKTYNDPFAKALRNRLRNEQVSLKIPVVFSKELPIIKQVDTAENKILPSSIFVPSSAGILCASYVIRKIITE